MNQQQIIEGIVTDVDFGYGLKYKDMDNLFLKLEIQQFDGTPCTQLFKKDKVTTILKQFQSRYNQQSSLQGLHHHRLYLLKENNNSISADAIAMLPPQGDTKFEWIYNDNWN